MNVLVVMPTFPRHQELLQAAAPDAEFTFCPAAQVTEEMIAKTEIVIGNLPPARLRGHRQLKWVQLNSAGTDGYTAPGVLPEGAQLTNATGAYGLAIAEHMLASLLFLMKKIHLYHEEQQKQQWSDHGQVTSIWGSNTLVVGLGDIGSEFAMQMHALGSTVTGIRRHAAEKPDTLAGLYQMDSLMEQLPKADIVAACLPGTAETLRVFDQAAFTAMKPGAFFLNVGRGSAVDSMALADALNSGHLAGAAVDVTDPEPLPPEHPLWKARNILITPHISGNYHLQETHERIIRIAAENLRRYTAGEPLKNLVDFATGYRRFSPDQDKTGV